MIKRLTPMQWKTLAMLHQGRGEPKGCRAETIGALVDAGYIRVDATETEAQTRRGRDFLEAHVRPSDVGADGRVRIRGDLRMDLLEWKMRRKKIAYAIECGGRVSGHAAGQRRKKRKPRRAR